MDFRARGSKRTMDHGQEPTWEEQNCWERTEPRRKMAPRNVTFRGGKWQNKDRSGNKRTILFFVKTCRRKRGELRGLAPSNLFWAAAHRFGCPSRRPSRMPQRPSVLAGSLRTCLVRHLRPVTSWISCKTGSETTSGPKPLPHFVRGAPCGRDAPPRVLPSCGGGPGMITFGTERPFSGGRGSRLPGDPRSPTGRGSLAQITLHCWAFPETSGVGRPAPLCNGPPVSDLR